MKFCSKCGKEIMEEAIVCPHCGCAATPAASGVATNDQVSVGLCILSVFIPLFGVIYWPVKHKETPKKARACGIAALISWGISVVFSILLTALGVGIAAGM